MRVQILTRDPDRGNPSPKRQGRWSGKPGLSWHAYVGRRPAKGRLVEAIGGCPYRTKVKRRKAFRGVGESARSDEARYLSACGRIGDEKGSKSLCLTLGDLAGSGHRERYAVGRKDESR